MPAVESFDVVIIGGGPAGVSCSLELKGNLVRHALLERAQELGGQLPQIAGRISNFAGLVFANGTALQNKLIKTANELNLPFRLNDEVIAVNLRQKTVKTRHGSLIGKVIVLATGARIRKLAVEQGGHLTGQILPKLAGRESENKGRAAIVIGGGDDALVDALSFTKHSPKVVLVCRSNQLEARSDLIDQARQNKKLEILTNCEVRKLIGRAKIEAVEVCDLDTSETQIFPIPLVVAKLGIAPNTELFAGQVAMSEGGCIQTNQCMQTSLAGVYAVGDLAFPSYWRLSTAAGQGAIAARAAINYLASLT
jgi:thioredoxin reductase (NADPH)